MSTAVSIGNLTFAEFSKEKLLELINNYMTYVIAVIISLSMTHLQCSHIVIFMGLFHAHRVLHYLKKHNWNLFQKEVSNIKLL